ncbi:MAG: DUF1800 family protein [Chitinophagales bacterium]
MYVQRKNQHLLWRAGFGPAADQFEMTRTQPPEKIFRLMLEAAQKDPVLFDVADPTLKAIVMGNDADPLSMRRNLSAEEKRNFRKQSVLDIRKLNIRWLQEMTETDAQLREKMSLFWHGHFATKTVNIIYDQELLNIIRQHALGNFRDLLFNVSKSASMIRFLNNDQNRKNHPNENFARELMELFTMGRGNYSEQDVKESARAFTGWGTTLQGDFTIRNRQHDEGPKTFLGKTGNLSGDDILDILLNKRQTAVFITRKIYRFFVNDPVDEKRVHELAERFFQSGYHIQKLLTDIFTSDWFYEEGNIGVHIKSPVEWIVGIRRQLPQEIEHPEAQILIQRLLGQVLFNPPNVAGWPGGRHWIDSSSLMLRLQIPRILYTSDAIAMSPKADDDLMMGMEGRGTGQPKKRQALRYGENARTGQFIRTKINWEKFIDHFQHTTAEDLFSTVRRLLLQTETTIPDAVLEKYLDQTNRNSLLQSAAIRYMGTPEYQLC